MQQLQTGHANIYFVTTTGIRNSNQLNWDWSDDKLNWDETRGWTAALAASQKISSKLGTLTDHVVSPKGIISLIKCRNSWISLTLKAGTVAVRSRLAPEFTEFACLGPTTRSRSYRTPGLRGWTSCTYFPFIRQFPPLLIVIWTFGYYSQLLVPGGARHRVQFSPRALCTLCAYQSRVGSPNTCSQVSVPYNVTII